MSSGYIIVCRTCGSYRTERVPCSKPASKPTRYKCGTCGDEFEVNDPAEYMSRHPPDIGRCATCDREAVDLVERNHQYAHKPEDEVVDLYRCSLCGQEIIKIVKRSRGVLYD